VEQRSIQALVVTPDPLLVTSFTDACRELGIEVRATIESDAARDALAREKYEAVLLDFDNLHDPSVIVTAIRQSPSNGHAFIFSVATETEQRREALSQDISLLLQRPLDDKELCRVLHAAYGLIVRLRRRYFRCVAEVPVLLIYSGSGADCKCTSMNLSSGGVGLRVPLPLQPGEEVQLILFLHGTDIIVRATGTVIWDDKHGKSGISFKCASHEYQAELDAWLDAHFHLPGVGDVRLQEVRP
jgi:CheY-like chemotaxis protein